MIVDKKYPTKKTDPTNIWLSDGTNAITIKKPTTAPTTPITR